MCRGYIARKAKNKWYYMMQKDHMNTLVTNWLATWKGLRKNGDLDTPKDEPCAQEKEYEKAMEDKEALKALHEKLKMTSTVSAPMYMLQVGTVFRHLFKCHYSAWVELYVLFIFTTAYSHYANSHIYIIEHLIDHLMQRLSI